MIVSTVKKFGAREEGPKITFFEDRAFTIENNTLRIQDDYIFTNPSSAEIDYGQKV